MNSTGPEGATSDSVRPTTEISRFPASVSIVIVTWNAKEIVRECLESMRDYGDLREVEIIVVDNASRDGTPEMVRTEFPFIQLIENSKNLGFAGANNIGLQVSKGEYVCLINSDVVLKHGCLESLVQFMERCPDIGLAGPRMRMPDGAIGESCMRFPSVWNWFMRAFAMDSILGRWRMFGGFLMKDFRYDRTVDVDVLTGWFWIARRKALDTVGFLDEQYFMYGEDIDWSQRFHLAGWRVVFCPEMEAVHYCGASSSRLPIEFYIEKTRANLQYFRTYHGRVAAAGFWVACCLHEFVRMVGFAASSLLQSSGGSIAEFKLQRSCRCLRWLLGYRDVKESQGRGQGTVG